MISLVATSVEVEHAQIILHPTSWVMLQSMGATSGYYLSTDY